MNGPPRYETIQSVWKCQIQLQLISYHFDENLFVKNKVALLRGFTNRLHNNTIENVIASYLNHLKNVYFRSLAK